MLLNEHFRGNYNSSNVIYSSIVHRHRQILADAELVYIGCRACLIFIILTHCNICMQESLYLEEHHVKLCSFYSNIVCFFHTTTEAFDIFIFVMPIF